MSLKDDDIVTRRIDRRSFLARAGTVLGGALGLLTVSSARAARDTQDYTQADNKAQNPHDHDRRSGDYVSGGKTEKPAKRDTQDYTQADNKAQNPHDHDRRSGDLVGR